MVGTTASKNLCLMFVVFYVCVRTNFVDSKEFYGLWTCIQNN